MKIATKLRERKDHFVITIYKSDRLKLDVSIGDIIILKLDKEELIRPVRKDFHISLPKRLLKNKTKGDKIGLHILKIAKTVDCTKRPENMIIKDKLDMRHFIPKNTLFGHKMYIIKRDEDSSSVWYPIGGGVKHVNIKNSIRPDKIAELIGFYFGDGNTSKDIRSFRLTNSEPSVLKCCLNILEELGISRDEFKIQIIYSTNRELTQEIKRKCIRFWSRTLNIPENKVVSVLKSKNSRETLEYGSARIFIDNSVLVEIMLHGLLRGILAKIINPKTQENKILLKGFIRGLLAAEGSVCLNNKGSTVKIGVAFDPHSEELKLYKTLLNNLRIKYGKTKGNELYICGHKNIKKLFGIEAFKMHKTRNAKFIKGFLNHKYTNLSQ